MGQVDNIIGGEIVTSRRQFLDPASIDEAIAEVAALAERSGVRVALIGGVAMGLLGSDRMTSDVDFVCSALPDHVQIRRALSFGGVAASTSKGHPVDLVVRNDVYAALYEEALESASNEPGLPVKVVRPEYLAAMKMAAGRDKDEADLKTLIRSGKVTFEGMAAVVQRHLGVYAVRELESLIAEVAWLASRESE